MYHRIKNRFTQVLSKPIGRLAVVGMATAATATTAMAGPPSVGDLELPVDLSSIVTVALAAVAAMLIAIIAPTLGLAVVKGIVRWARSFSKGHA